MRQKSLANSLISPEEKTDGVGRAPQSRMLPRPRETSKTRVGMSVEVQLRTPSPDMVGSPAALAECGSVDHLVGAGD